MSKPQRYFIVTIILALLFVLPTAALASKRLYQARLTTGAELHTVVGSTAVGSMTLGTSPNGSLHFILQVRGLSGSPTAAHIHGPADATQNAGVLIPLCGGTALACPVLDANNNWYLEGNITSSQLAQAGLTGATFMSYLEGGLLYVNVHTALNPAGEARGQIYPR
jgi:hypothetical protein